MSIPNAAWPKLRARGGIITDAIHPYWLRGMQKCFLARAGANGALDIISGEGRQGEIGFITVEEENRFYGWEPTSSNDGMVFVAPAETPGDQITVFARALGDVTNTSNPYLVGLNPGGFLSKFGTETRVSIAGGTANFGDDSISEDGIMHDYCAMYDGANVHAYFDGELKNTAATTGNMTTPNNIGVGTFSDESNDAWNWIGRIELVIVWYIARSPLEIALLFANPWRIFNSLAIQYIPFAIADVAADIRVAQFRHQSFGIHGLQQLMGQGR